MKVKRIEINVSNDDTKYFVLKSGEDYDYYLRCMYEYMGERFYHNLEDDSYMEGVLKSIIENGKKDFNEFLKNINIKHRLKTYILMKCLST